MTHADTMGPGDSIVLFGVETSFAADCIDTLRRLNLGVAAGILLDAPIWSLRSANILLHPEEISPLLQALPALLCASGPLSRRKHHALASSLGFSRFLSLIDPTAVVPDSAFLGTGCYVNANATLGSAAEIDDFALINRAASIGHHTVIESYATVGPGATLASHCHVGKAAMIGAGAVIAPSIHIGDEAVVGAGAVVHRDVPAGTSVIGNPARPAPK